MMISPGYVGLAVGLLALIAASIFDIKTREVPDWLNFSLLAFALASAAILSIYHGYAHILLEAAYGLAVGLAIGLLMFYTGQWGGGDAKLIIALAALIGFSFSEISQAIPLFIVFLVNILLVGAIYGLAYSLYKAFRNHKAFKQAVLEKIRTKGIIWVRVALIILVIAGFIFLFVTRSVESVFAFGLAVFLFFFFYLWVFVTAVEKTCMVKKVKVRQLTDGDWIVGNVMKGKKIMLQPSKTGITLKQIAMLKKHMIREVTIKVGIPFVPSFLIAYILTFTLGNWLVFLI